MLIGGSNEFFITINFIRRFFHVRRTGFGGKVLAVIEQGIGYNLPYAVLPYAEEHGAADKMANKAQCDSTTDSRKGKAYLALACAKCTRKAENGIRKHVIKKQASDKHCGGKSPA